MRFLKKIRTLLKYRNVDVVRVEKYHRCWHCGFPTKSVDICFEASIHRGWCLYKKNQEYWKAVSQ